MRTFYPQEYADKRIRSPTGLFRQTIYWPLYLFSKYMREGISVRVSLSSPTFAGETLPTWITDVKGQPSILDASAVLQVDGSGKRSLRIAVINRSETESFRVPVRVAFEDANLQGTSVEVHELWHKDIHAKNCWDSENEVSVQTSQASWDGEWTFKEHSFTLLVLTSK